MIDFELNLFRILILLLISGCHTDISDSQIQTPSIIHLTEDLVVEKGDSLVFAKGTEVLIDSGVNIIAHGDVFIRGTEDFPVTLKGSSPDKGWGVLSAKGTCRNLIIHNAVIENGRITSYQSKNHFKNILFKNNQMLVWNDAIARFWYGAVLIENCRVEGINRGEGFLLHNVQEPIVRNCFFTKIPDAVEFIDCKNGEIISNHFEKMNDDAIDQNSCFNTLIKNNRIFDVKDCGMELGSENFGSSDSLRLDNNLIVNCGKGIIIKESSYVIVENSTFFNNKIGIEIHNAPDSSRTSRAVISHTVIAEGETPILLSENTDLNLQSCLSENPLPSGINVLQTSVEFEDPSNLKFSIISKDFPEGTNIENLGYQTKN